MGNDGKSDDRANGKTKVRTNGKDRHACSHIAARKKIHRLITFRKE
jgi:hypothetical protein